MADRRRLFSGLSRWANQNRLDAEDMRKSFADVSCVAIADAPDRERVRLRGTLKSVVLQPRGGAPALEAELYDGTGVVTIVWLGRRRITGIAPGKSVQVEGRIGVQDQRRVIFNPRYEFRQNP